MNTASKDRLIQQLRLFGKIEGMLSGIIQKDNMTYLFWMHFVSGLLQSKQGGLPCEMFSNMVNYNEYRGYFADFRAIKKQFFKNEHASRLGRKRIELFAYLMKKGKYKTAGMVMGLK